MPTRHRAKEYCAVSSISVESRCRSGSKLVFTVRLKNMRAVLSAAGQNSAEKSVAEARPDNMEIVFFETIVDLRLVSFGLHFRRASGTTF